MSGLSGDFLHIGCGRMQPDETDQLPSWAKGCKETRLDIDSTAEPDIVTSMVDLGDIGPFDITYSCHTLEHLYPHQVLDALVQQFRVLRLGGVAISFVPDLEGVLATDDPIYTSVMGDTISGLDMIYGKASYIACNPHMAHHCGFTSKTLAEVFQAAGFVEVTTKRIANSILCTGRKPL
jgi:hypothetical protein